MIGVGREKSVEKTVFAPPFFLSQAFVLSQLPAGLQFQQNYIEVSESKV